MTSRDVKETLQRLIDLNSPAVSLYKDIERVEVEGDHRIRFVLSRPNLFFLHLFSCIHMSILPYDIDITSEVSGTGPYRLLDLNEDVLVLAAFDFYFEFGRSWIVLRFGICQKRLLMNANTSCQILNMESFYLISSAITV